MLSAALLAAAACSGVPDEEEIADEVFGRISVLLRRYNGALESRDPLMLESVGNELRAEVSADFPVVLAGAGSVDPERRADAASALGFSRNRDAVPTLVAATGASDVETRTNAAASLGMLAFPDTDPAPLVRLLLDVSPRVRGAALFGIRSMAGEGNAVALLPPVLRMIDDPDAMVRAEAMLALAKLRRPESREPILAKGSKDPDPLVRANSAVAVGALGRDAAPATAALIEMLRDDVAKVVEAAWRALNRIHGKDLDRSYGTWREWYEDELRHHYFCEEHKDLVQPHPGSCPKCGKKLDRAPKEVVRKGEPPGFFVCAEHPEIQTLGPASCGKCNKPLVPGKPEGLIYACPAHPEVVTNGPVPCGRPGCGKTLVPRAK
jgi:HEAT repeats